MLMSGPGSSTWRGPSGRSLCACFGRDLLEMLHLGLIKMKPKIWLRSAKRTWEETTIDDKGTLNISRIAKWIDLRLETLLFGDLAAYEGITIEDVRDSCRSTAGQLRDN